MNELILPVVFALLGVVLWQFVPVFPVGFEGASTKRVFKEVTARLAYRSLIYAERFGLIDDSATGVQKLLNKSLSRNISNLKVPGESTSISGVPVLIFRKNKAESNQKTLIYFHGGGFIVGNTGLYSKWTSLLAEATAATVISVEYRLAPQHPFPAAFDDCLRVTKAVFDNAETLKVDKRRIAVAGDSAGANLASIVAIELANSANYKLKAQLLLSTVALPVGVLYIPSTVKYNLLNPLGSDWFLTKYAGQKYSKAVENAMLSRKYLTKQETKVISDLVKLSAMPSDLVELITDGSSYNDEELPLGGIESAQLAVFPKELHKIRELALNERSWPLLIKDSKRLVNAAPAFFSVCEYDTLRDEDLLYFAKLRSLGVPVTLSYLPKAEHIEPVLAHLTGDSPTPISQKGFKDIIDFLVNHL